MLIGGLQASKGVIAVGTYSFLVFITQRLLWPLTTLGRTLNEYQRSMASTNRVLDLIDTPVLIAGGERRLNPQDIQERFATSRSASPIETVRNCCKISI